ncbi:MAG: hypothetical protein ABWK00_01420 [Desulfurococcaceae archaeon]
MGLVKLEEREEELTYAVMLGVFVILTLLLLGFLVIEAGGFQLGTAIIYSTLALLSTNTMYALMLILVLKREIAKCRSRGEASREAA